MDESGVRELHLTLLHWLAVNCVHIKLMNVLWMDSHSFGPRF